jgi:hypothetical protein
LHERIRPDSTSRPARFDAFITKVPRWPLIPIGPYRTIVIDRTISGSPLLRKSNPGPHFASIGRGSGMMDTTGGTRWPLVPTVLGMILFAAGAADGHDLIISARDADWVLLVRAELELLGGVWLLSRRLASTARIVAIAACGSLLASDLVRALAGNPSRYLIGRVAGGHGYVLITDLLVLAGLLRSRTAPEYAKRMASHPGRLAGAMLIAAAFGVAIDRSQVGQFPLIATVKAGQSSSWLDYLVYLPDGYYRSLRRWPLILTLHGRGEAGNDIDLVRLQGLPRRVEEEGGLPFVIVAPQSAGWAWDVGSLGVLLDEVLRKYRVAPDRVYLTGNSMGGNGTWALAADRPECFAAIAPICGTGDPASAARLRGVPTWAYHGADDRIVPVEKSERMIAALREAGGDARLTVYPGIGHDSWTPTYANPRFYEWLLQHRRGSIPDGSSPVSVGVPASAGQDQSPAGREESPGRIEPSDEFPAGSEGANGSPGKTKSSSIASASCRKDRASGSSAHSRRFIASRSRARAARASAVRPRRCWASARIAGTAGCDGSWVSALIRSARMSEATASGYWPSRYWATPRVVR